MFYHSPVKKSRRIRVTYLLIGESETRQEHTVNVELFRPMFPLLYYKIYIVEQS